MKIITIIMGIFLTIGGFFVFRTPVQTFFSIGWIIGILLLISGINIIMDHFILKKGNVKGHWDLVGGILTILMGFLLLYSQIAEIALNNIILFIFGSWVLISGIIRIVVSFQHRKSGEKIWIWIFIMGVISILLGVYGFVNPMVFKFAIGFMIGFFIMMQGINLIGLGFSIGKVTGNNNQNNNKAS